MIEHEDLHSRHLRKRKVFLHRFNTISAIAELIFLIYFIVPMPRLMFVNPYAAGG